MALGTPTSRVTGTTAGTATTASFTVPAGDVIFVSRGIRTGTAQGSSFTISDSQGLTWTSLCDVPYRPVSIGMRLQVWWAVSNGNAMTVTLTAGATGANQGRTEIFSISGADTTDFANKNSATHATGAPSVLLPNVPGASNTVVGWNIGSGSTTIAPPTGFTELDEVGAASAIMEVAYDAASAPQTVAWSTAGTGESVAFALEIKTASASTGVGSSAGTGAATGIGSAKFTAAGSSTGTGTATGIGNAPSAAIGAATGAGTATGVGNAPSGGIGASAGSGTATGVGASIGAAAGSSAGTGAATGVGSSVASGVGSSTGVGSATATGLTAAMGEAAGSATVIGIGAAIASGVGNAEGTGLAQGISPPRPPRVFIRRSELLAPERLGRSHEASGGRTYASGGGRSSRQGSGRSYGSYRGR